MLKVFKKQLSRAKRGIAGFRRNSVEKVVSVNSSIKHFQIGLSVENRGLECFQINNGPINLLFVSAIHGNEVGTVKLSHRLINWLFENRNRYPKFTFNVIDCLNIDGYHSAMKSPDYFGGGKVGRLNSHKVDLNRNFPTPSFQSTAAWTHGKSYEDSTEVFAGPRAASEPEVQAFIKLTQAQKPAVIFSFHNAGGDLVGNKTILAQKLAKLYSHITGYHYLSVENWTKFNQTGSSLEWCTLNNIPILEIETENRWSSDWLRNQKAIEESLKVISNREE